MPAPNLDAMTAEALAAFALAATEDTMSTARSLFPGSALGCAGATLRLGVYAGLRVDMLLAREGGLTGLAARQKAKLADIYASLPGYARWRLWPTR